MISMKDYAKANGITYEAVRAQVKRYREQLDDHIIQDGRTQFLDDIAVAFLDERRQKNPVVVYQQSKDETIDLLEQERDLLLQKIAAQADRIAELAQWKADKALEIASAEQTRLLLTAAEQEKRLLEGFVADAKAEIAVLSDEKAQAEQKAAQAAEDAQKAQGELTAAQERERELKEYLAKLSAWSSLSGWKRLNVKKHPKPVAPEWLEEK